MAPKTLLVNVCYDYPVVTEGIFTGINKIWQPISLAYATAILKTEGMEVKLLDANALRIRPGDTGRLYPGYDFAFVSSTSYDRWECPHLDLKPAVETCKSIREHSPKTVIFLVGAHGTVLPKEMIELTGADAVLIGEPEYAIRDVVLAGDWRTAGGVAYVEGDVLKKNPRVKPFDLDKLPLPEFGDLPMEKYSFDMLGGRFAVLEASRGCPFRCFYCLKVMFGPYRKKSLDNLKREILYVVKTFGTKRINFLDLEFTVNRPLVEGMCEWLVNEGIRLEWSCQTRLDSVDEELLGRMKEAGCRLVMYGVESGSQRIIDIIGKNTTIEDFRSGIAATRRVGIESVCFFMFGFPSETGGEREETVKLALELNPDYASFFLCRPYPGTECYDKVADVSPGLFPLGVGDEKELRELKAFCDRAFGRFYYRPSLIIKRLLRGDWRLIFNQIRVFLHKRGWVGDRA